MDLDHFAGRLERILKGISLRLKLLFTLEFILKMASTFLVTLLGSLFVPSAQETFPYLPFVYYLLALISLILVFLLGSRRIISRLSSQRIARGLEQKFPQLKDDVTNALLLSHQIENSSDAETISKPLVTAHLQMTSAAVSKIHPKQVVSFRRLWPHLKLFLPLSFVFIVALTMNPLLLRHSISFIFHPFSALPMQAASIIIEPPSPVQLRGSPVIIRAAARGHIPDRLLLRLWPENSAVIQLDMDSEGNGRFSHRILSVQSSFRYQALSNRASSAGYFIKVVDAPDIGKIKLTLIPPDYTGLASKVSEGGPIEALKGTLANLDVQLTKAVTAAKLILNQTNQLPLKVNGDQLKGTFLVFRPGTYSLSIRDELGFENPSPVSYRIHLTPDQYPRGKIISPPQDLDISSNKPIPLIYSAKDDFGLTAIRLIYQKGALERTITLKSLKDTRSAGPEIFEWDLGNLALIPGDRVAYRLEVWDNDSVSGPKAGYSRTFTLHMRNENDRATRELDRAQKIADALLDLLADQLENLKDTPALSDEIERIMEKIDHQLERMGRNKIEHFDLDSLKQNLATLHRRIGILPRETITQEMERLALLADDLLKKARMHTVETMAQEIKNRQKRLIEALRDHKGPLTPEDRQALLKELEKLKGLISKVMDALTRMASRLPQEFINNPDVNALQFQDLFKDIDEIQKKLKAGNLAGALESAQKLLQTLSDMMAAMAQAGAQARTGAFGRLQSEISHQANALEKILVEQKKVLSGTESVEKELNRLIAAETEIRLNERMPRLQESLDQLQGLLPSEQGDFILGMKKLLEEKQLKKFSDSAERFREVLANRPDVRQLVDELIDRSRALTPLSGEVMTADSGAAVVDLSSRQEKLQDRTGDLGEALERLAQLYPGMDTKIITDLKNAAAAMGRASGKLKATDAAGAIPPEQEAIRDLTRSQQAARQMAQQMARQMAMNRQANRWGYHWGYDSRYGWYYGPGIPLPTLPQPKVKRPRIRGYTGIDKEEFDPPDKDAYKAPQELREKVMEALKEDIPSQYRREVEKYFRGLTE